MRAVVALHEAFTFLYWNRRPLRKTEMPSHDANVTMATKVTGSVRRSHR